MKLVTYRVRADDHDRVGVLTPEASAVVDLSSDFSDMLELIESGPEALALARERQDRARASLTTPIEAVTLRAPLQPTQMRDMMAFEQHFQQAIDAVARMRAGPIAPLARLLGITKIPRVWYLQPIYYKCNRFAVNGHEAPVIWPRDARLMDYELEIAAVIGKPGKDISREHAFEHIFGFMIFNDMTARDFQLSEMDGRLGPAKGKDFDTGNVLGPWLVTRDELDPYALTMIVRVNGEERGRGWSGDMYHSWEDILAYVSRDETLHAGEVLGSGTVGNGCGLEHRRFLSPGDVIELEVSGLGVLRNQVVQP